MTAGTVPHLLHAALLFDSADELADAAVPFLADGLAAGEAAVLACREDDNARLAEAVGDDRLLVLDREEIYTGCARALATYRRMVHRRVAAGAARIRLVCAVPLDQRPQQWDEWHCYEAVFNAAMGRMPLSAVCAYDRREISSTMRNGIGQTHPVILTPGGLVPNGGYREPATVLGRTVTAPGNAIFSDPPTLDLADQVEATRLPELREQVRSALDGAGAQGPLRGRFAAAVIEVLSNAFQHGAPPVSVRLWITPARLEAAITDCGQGFDDPLAGFIPPGEGPSPARAGLWVARQACDSLDVVRTPSGFTVRLGTALPGSDTAPDAAPPTDSATVRAGRARADARELARRLQQQLEMS
jgi:anti-sigma regulatory factor (Ser/Thr protein kinase)